MNYPPRSSHRSSRARNSGLVKRRPGARQKIAAVPSLVFVALALGFSHLYAQNSQQRALSFDVRGGYGFPIGDFGDNVDSDFGFGVGAVLNLTNSIGVYGGWARDSFQCDNIVCTSNDQVHLSGFELGGKFIIPSENGVFPWLKVGVVADKVQFDTAIGDFESDREWGFQAAAGLDFPLGNVLSVSPGLRLTLLDYNDAGFFSQSEVRHLSVDLGAHINIPGN